MHVVMNKCFPLHLETKNWHRSVLSSTRKAQTLIPKNDVTEPKIRRLGYSNQLKCW